VNRSAQCVSAMMLVAVFAVASESACAAGQKAGKNDHVYKWVDEKGIVHYGDHVPPEYSKQERRLLNEQGVEVGRLDAQKTDAQLANEEAQRRLIASSRQRDKTLLTTYVSEEQLEQLRDQRLDLIEGQVQVTTLYLENLQGRLERLHSQAQFFKPYSSNAGAGPLPDQLAADLVRTIREIGLQMRNLDGKRKEQSLLREQFQADLDRYRQLKAGAR
jgi:Domain of unknown function (DUF4124)